MPRYTFKLRDDDGGVEDGDGVNLPDAEIAYRYACDVPFVRLDQTLDHLNAQTREMIERGESQIRSAKDICEVARATVREAKSLVARSHGKLYLAADRGKKIIRD